MNAQLTFKSYYNIQCLNHNTLTKSSGFHSHNFIALNNSNINPPFVSLLEIPNDQSPNDLSTNFWVLNFMPPE